MRAPPAPGFRSPAFLHFGHERVEIPSVRQSVPVCVLGAVTGSLFLLLQPGQPITVFVAFPASDAVTVGIHAIPADIVGSW